MPIPRKSGGVGRPLRRALGLPTGLRALRHAAAAPTRQEFELRKKIPSLAHRTTPYCDPDSDEWVSGRPHWNFKERLVFLDCSDGCLGSCLVILALPASSI